jgi:hypothetical protein
MIEHFVRIDGRHEKWMSLNAEINVTKVEPCTSLNILIVSSAQSVVSSAQSVVSSALSIIVTFVESSHQTEINLGRYGEPHDLFLGLYIHEL